MPATSHCSQPIGIETFALQMAIRRSIGTRVGYTKNDRWLHMQCIDVRRVFIFAWCPTTRDSGVSHLRDGMSTDRMVMPNTVRLIVLLYDWLGTIQ